MNIFERIFADTPKFFKKVRNIGLTVAAVGTAIVTLPLSLPTVVVTAAGYLITAGTAAATVAQTVFKTDPDTYDPTKK